jgi:peptide/nickel transport system permease protein
MMIPTLFMVSVVSFVIIELPPHTYFVYSSPGLNASYGMGQPIYVQYALWIEGILLHGNFGQSFAWNEPVTRLLMQRLPGDLLIGGTALFFTWAVSLPIGVISAARKYSIADHTATLISFVALGVPNFLMALILGYLSFKFFHQSAGGLFSPEFQSARWDLGKVLDLLSHLWLPVVVIAAQGTASIVRILRANLLDELRKPYVTTGRAKGLSEMRLLLKYPLRVALNPFVSTMGWALPAIINGEVIISQVLDLQTTGQLLLGALQDEDMYLAGSIILIISTLTVLGTLMSDLLLAVVDPRVR